MKDRKKVTLSLTAEALAALNLHASERKRGEFVSGLILEFDRQAGLLLDLTPGEQLATAEIRRMIQEVDDRLERIERLLSQWPGQE